MPSHPERVRRHYGAWLTCVFCKLGFFQRQDPIVCCPACEDMLDAGRFMEIELK